MKLRLTKIALFSVLALTLLLGCKDFWHPEGSEMGSEREHEEGKHDGDESGSGITGLSWKWETFSDRDDNGGSSNITGTTGTEDGMTTHRYYGNITNQYEYGFAGFKIIPNNTTSGQALRTASSFSFKVKGDNQSYSVKMPTSNITDYCYYETTFYASSSTTTVTVNITDLAQPIWGISKPFNQNTVEMIEFQTTHNGIPGTFDLTIWDFKVYR